MEDGLVVDTLVRTAILVAHPERGRNFDGGLAMLDCAERHTALDSKEALRLAGYRGIIYLWQDRPSVAVVTLRYAGERASDLGYYQLRHWLYEQLAMAETYLRDVQAKSPAA